MEHSEQLQLLQVYQSHILFNMKSKTTTILLLAGIGLFTLGCKPEYKDQEYHLGEINTAKFISIGSTFSAGYADGALYYEAQENAYPALLAKQFGEINSINFKIPYVPFSSVGLGIKGNSRSFLSYKTDCTGATSLSPIPFASTGDALIWNETVFASQGAFQNMSVPFATITDLVRLNYGNSSLGAGNYNPYFSRFASSQSASVFQDVQSQSPTFFTLSAGEQDVLNYALSGGTGSLPTPTQGASGVGFKGSLEFMVNALTDAGAKGALATLPDITETAFFNTIPYNGLKLDQANADQLNGVLNPYGIFFHVGNNPFLIEDASAQPIGVRLMTPNEKILLSIPLDSVKCNKMGSLTPIPNRHVLTEAEIQVIRNATTEYNAEIKAIANQKGLALADIASLYKSFVTGINYNGINVNAKFVSGGAFSLDGMQLNPIGNALVANEFIKAINKTYKAKIPQLDASKYRGVKFP